MPEVIDLSSSTVGFHRDGTTSVEPNRSGPPRRIDGFIVGAPMITRDPPHNGELHPDADELLFLVSGHVDIVMEIEGREETTELQAGDACIVPRGTWHRTRRREPSQILHVTPGPGGEWRLPEGPA